MSHIGQSLYQFNYPKISFIIGKSINFNINNISNLRMPTLTSNSRHQIQLFQFFNLILLNSHQHYHIFDINIQNQNPRLILKSINSELLRMSQQQKYKYLETRLVELKQEQLLSVLKCPICEGFLRFAHTLIQCGHTFCQICIFNYIRSYKGRNPDVKCPRCHDVLDQNYNRSIMKDVYKQSLVDLVEPRYAQEQAVIVKRVQTLFPQFDIEAFMDQFKYETWQAPRKRKKNQEKSPLMKLPDKIKQTLGLTLQKFAVLIQSQENYEEFKRIVSKKNSANVIEIEPLTQRDFKYVGMKTKMKINSQLTCLKLRRFLEKKVLQIAQQTKEIANQWILPNSEKLNIKVTLRMGDKHLQDDETIQTVMTDSVVHYTVN